MLYGIPVADLQDKISSAHFAELVAFDRVYGLPDSWYRTIAVGLIGKDARPIPEHAIAGARRRQTPEEFARVMDNVVRSTGLAFNGRK